MAKKKLLEDIKLQPSRFYRLPSDVIRDRRFSDADRLEILQAWLLDAGAMTAQVEIALGELQGRLAAGTHAAE
jgi:hypothetical protein